MSRQVNNAIATLEGLLSILRDDSKPIVASIPVSVPVTVPMSVPVPVPAALPAKVAAIDPNKRTRIKGFSVWFRYISFELKQKRKREGKTRERDWHIYQSSKPKNRRYILAPATGCQPDDMLPLNTRAINRIRSVFDKYPSHWRALAEYEELHAMCEPHIIARDYSEVSELDREWMEFI